jgi:hypothetical protein
VIRKMAPVLRTIILFEKAMVSGINRIFCVMRAILSMSETSVAALKKIGEAKNKHH